MKILNSIELAAISGGWYCSGERSNDTLLVKIEYWPGFWRKTGKSSVDCIYSDGQKLEYVVSGVDQPGAWAFENNLGGYKVYKCVRSRKECGFTWAYD